MGCCNGFSRWLIGIVSVCVIICAVVAAVIVYTKEKNQDWAKLIKNNLPFIFILIAMAFAIVSSIIGFLLCCCQKRCLYITYLIIIVIVIAVEIVAVVLAFRFKDKIIDGIEENWMNDKYKNTRISIEENMQCCGFKTEEPLSDCGYKPKNEKAVLCFNKISDEINSHIKQLQIAAIVMTVVEVILLVCASYLVCCENLKVSN